MDRLRELRRLQYVDPETVLFRLFGVDVAVSQSQLPERVRNLRTNELKPWRELRAGCLFAYGMSQRNGRKILIARPEKENCDYDFATLHEQSADTTALGAVQLKELVPHKLNQRTSVQEITDGLRIYSGQKDLVVLIHLNRRVEFDPASLALLKLKLASLWAIGTLTSDPYGEWALWGDLLTTSACTTFAYPLKDRDASGTDLLQDAAG